MISKSLALLAFSPILCFVLFAGCSPANPAKPLDKIPKLDLGKATERERAKDFTVSDLYGKSYSKSDFKGKVVLLNFWSSWCFTCKEEMQTLSNLSRGYAGDLAILAVAVDDDETALKKFIAENTLDYPVLIVQGGLAKQAYDVTGLPQSHIIDRNGALVSFPDPESGTSTTVVIGPREWDSPRVRQVIDQLLAE